MDLRIERALNHPACVKPLHRTGWREHGSSIRYFTGEFVEYGYHEPFSNDQEIIMSDVPSQPEPEPETPEPPADPQPEDAPADAPG